jgi:hypothetical protein
VSARIVEARSDQPLDAELAHVAEGHRLAGAWTAAATPTSVWLLCPRAEKPAQRRATVRAVCCHKKNYETNAAW